MKRENGQLLWFDGASAERSKQRVIPHGETLEPSNHTGENCAYIGLIQKWNDNTCDYKKYRASFVLC